MTHDDVFGPQVKFWDVALVVDRLALAGLLCPLYELHVPTITGEPRFVLVHKCALRDTNGQPTALCGIPPTSPRWFLGSPLPR